MGRLYGGGAGNSWELFLWEIATGTDPHQTMACRTDAAGLPLILSQD